ncbi:hypothetical protein [Streptomyces sp. MUSC 14]|uniref:hypothetical protein n=1 Tax=Streptomyces sp. MUSC 14 TaxID=1354889 RepID=UPI000AF1AF05|nr:hypothetical protein [Streptomyces sp. MUSC 14]
MTRAEIRQVDLRRVELSELFAAEVRDLVPPPVPLAEIECEGRAWRRRRRVRRLTTLVVLLGTIACVVVPRVTGRTASGAPTPSTSAASTVRVVAAGEHVRPLPNVELWLAKDGEHWSAAPGLVLAPTGRAGGKASVTMTVLGTGNRYLMTGTYRGPTPAARVTLRAPFGTTSGTLLTLAGSPGWSAWYATGELPKGKEQLLKARVTIHDARGSVVTQGGVGR